MVKTATKSVCIAQTISQDQSCEFIGFFLQKTFKNLKSPIEVVCDESKALLKALVKTFTTCHNLESYITTCMAALFTGSTPPLCYIRIDRSHFIKNIMRKIKHKDYRKRNFFRSIIGFLIQCENFATVRKIISDFFTLILNENDGFDEFGDNLPAEVAKKRLHSLCITHDANVDYADSSDSDNLESDDPDKDLDYDADIKWLDEIIGRVKRRRKTITKMCISALATKKCM